MNKKNRAAGNMKNKKLAVDYTQWIGELKQRFQQAQIKAAVKVNSTLLAFYWDLGADIVEKQKGGMWGTGLLKQLSADLMAAFPEVKGFSVNNLQYVVRWHSFYASNSSNVEQAVPHLETDLQGLATTCRQIEKEEQAVSHLNSPISLPLFQIPWGQNLVIISKCSSMEEALFYVQKTIENGWSRNGLIHQIESDLWNRDGKAITNFETQLPAVDSDLAKQILKDPYNFEFLTLTEKFKEREPEKGLTAHIEKFLLELGSGFAFVGRQCQLEYALKRVDAPMGVSEYQLAESLPENLKSALPTVEEIEAEIGGADHE